MSRMERIPCDQVIGKLWEYIDGEISETDAARIRQHLDMCSNCFPQYDFQRAYKEFIARRAGQTMPAELRRRVFQSILAEEARASPLGRMARLRASLSRLIRRK